MSLHLVCQGSANVDMVEGGEGEEEEEGEGGKGVVVPLREGMVTLSTLPKSHWSNLQNIDIIKVCMPVVSACVCAYMCVC